MIPIMLRRRVMPSGEPMVVWHKYSCVRTSYYTAATAGSGNTSYDTFSSTSQSVTAYSSYSWSSSAGFKGSGTTTTLRHNTSGSTARGKYRVYSTSVWQYTGGTSTNASGKPQLERKQVLQCSMAYNNSKGTTDYGTVMAKPGTIPDGGTTLYGGSLDGDYCVTYVGGSYYYYERV